MLLWKRFRGQDRETLERNDTWVYLGNLLFPFLFIICFVSMGTKCLLGTRFFSYSPYFMSSWWLQYFERIKEVSASMFAFRPGGAVSFLIWLHHFPFAAKPGFCQHPALGTYLPVNSLVLSEHWLKGTTTTVFHLRSLSSLTLLHMVEGQKEKASTTDEHKTVDQSKDPFQSTFAGLWKAA